jgi:hypothetical protein
MRLRRLLLLVWLLTWLQPATASAEWLIWPYLGLKFAGSTSLADPEEGAGATKLTLGGSVTLLGDGVLGIEGDFGYSPRFFERDLPEPRITSSSVLTLTGSVMAAVPRSVTRDSLRPYVLGGLGLMHVGIDYVADLLPPVDSNVLCLSLGGGAIGPITQRTSVRFEIRHFRNLTAEDEDLSFGTTRLSFWRATVGVTLRY